MELDLAAILGEWSPPKWHTLVKTYVNILVQKLFKSIGHHFGIYSSMYNEPADAEDLGNPFIKTDVIQQDTYVLAKDE